MALTPLSFVMLLYLLVRLVWPLALSWRVKCVLGVVLAFVSQKFLLYRTLGGSVSGPTMPQPFLLGMEVLYTTILMVFFWVVIRDIIALFLWLLRRTEGGRFASWYLPYSKNIQAGIILTVAMITSVYGVWQATKVPDVRTIEITIPHLPSELDGFVIVQLSDTHIGPILQKEWLEEVVAKTNAIEPDMIVLTGDFIDGHPKDMGYMVEPFADLEAPYGVFGIMGNHEYYSQMPVWDTVLKKLGFDMLHNEQRTIQVGDASFVLVGVTDPAAGRFGEELPNGGKAFMRGKQGYEYDEKTVYILLDHQSRYAFQNPEADLQLSGHTHGGQMFLLEKIVARANGGYVRGLYEKDGQQLYVSSGTGLWYGLSSRLGIPSEITKIILR